MARPLNFLHLTTFYPPYSFGGDAMYIYRLSHALADAGHHVDVVHLEDAYHMQHPAEPEILFKEHPNVRRHGLKSRHGLTSLLLTHQTGQPFLQWDRLHKVLKDRLFDVIHFHNISLLGPGILKIEQDGGRPIKLYTTHEHWLICPTHVLWKFNRRACERPQCLPCTLLARRPPQVWRYTGLLQRMSKHVDRFVSPSRFTAEMHKKRGFIQSVGHLPYFIERADQDWQSPQPRPQEKPYFLFVGRLEAIKGLQTIIPLWKHVSQYELLIAGTGNQETELRNMAGQNENIKFLGPMSQHDLGNYYYHALATIVPSLTYETFGIIIVESFARKAPVIVRDLGALPEVVQDSNGGFVYREDKELLEAIHRIGTSPHLRRSLGENGYASFIKNWSKEAHLSLYFELLEQLAVQKYGSKPWEETLDTFVA